jgi:hypothetical protein
MSKVRPTIIFLQQAEQEPHVISAHELSPCHKAIIKQKLCPDNGALALPAAAGAGLAAAVTTEEVVGSGASRGAQ